MKGKKIFVLIQDSIYDCDVNNIVEVYSSFESAKKDFDKLVSNARKEAENNDWLIETDEDMSFCAYEDGEYVYFHTDISIKEQEIK